MQKRKKHDYNDIIEMFVLGAFVGFVLEFLLGWTIFLFTGNFLWIYPNSSLVTTSLITFPIWGLAGLVFIVIWKFVKKHNIF